jgi:hypothetical protein
VRKDTKLAQVRAAMEREDWDTAILLVSKFNRLGEHGEAIRRGREAINNPDFYRQLGNDIGAIRASAIAALKERYSTSWQSLRTHRPKKASNPKNRR